MKNSLLWSILLLRPALKALAWVRIYRKNAWLFHRPCIMILSDLTLFKYKNIANDDRMECVPTSLPVIPRVSLPRSATVFRICCNTVELLIL